MLGSSTIPSRRSPATRLREAWVARRGSCPPGDRQTFRLAPGTGGGIVNCPHCSLIAGARLPAHVARSCATTHAVAVPSPDAPLEGSGPSQRELAARSGVSPTIIDRMLNHHVEQVALKTRDSLSLALGQAIGGTAKPGERLGREPAPERRGRQ